MLDRASICVRGGRGGNGSTSFRREKYVPKGGPDGGDGAAGGDVVLVATRQLHDLSHFRHKHHFRAANGGHGRGANKRGADGPELLVQVPVGTEVRDAGGTLLGEKIKVFTYKPKSTFKKTKGHRSRLSKLTIESITLKESKEKQGGA
jgi:GTP-binding protein